MARLSGWTCHRLALTPWEVKFLVMLVPALIPTFSCQSRELLVYNFKRALDTYNRTLTSLLDKMELDKAIEQTDSLYQDCLTSRKRLQEHEAKHGCYWEPATHTGDRFRSSRASIMES